MEQTSAKRKNITYYIRTFLVSAVFAAIVLCFRLGTLPGILFVDTMIFPLSDLFVILGAGLCGYRYGLVMFLMIFLTETAVSGGNLTQLYPLFLYLILALLSGILSQNRWYASVRKTLLSFVILEAVLGSIFYLIFSFMITGGEVGIVSAFLGTVPESSVAVLLLWLYFRFTPDKIKRAFGVGNRYTKDYNANGESYGSGRYTSLKRRITIISIFEGILFAVLSNAQFSAVLETFMTFFPSLGGERTSDAFAAPTINNFTISLSILLLALTLSISVAVIANEAILNMVLQVTGEQQKLETELKVAKAKSDAKSSFLSSMSHEIRTPINAVLGMNEMVLRECEDENILTYSESIRTAGNTLLGLVNDILDFSKIEAGKMDIIPVDYDIASTLNDLVNMVQTRAEEKGLVLKLNIDGNIPKLLHGDDVRIKQVITNILTNAVKYTEKGSVTFSVGYSKVDESRIDLKVSIADTGIGIKSEDIPKLFTEFDRIEEERNRSIEGTGLGMSITQKLLALMNSRLEVESEYGRGSVFSFILRQAVVKWEPVGDYEEAFRHSLANRKKYRERFTAPGAHILVVDDTPMNLEVIVSLLKKTRIKIDTAESGDECISLAAKHKYDVILLDHMMPEKNGIETLAELKAMPDNPNFGTPAICLTANAVSGAREQYLAAGFDDYLTKPVEPSKLEQMIMDYLPEEKIIQFTEEISGRSVSASGRSAVLVVDDDELIRKNAESILRPSYDIICADSGKTAIETAERERPDLILLDINLGGMDGFDVLRQLKKSDTAHDIPVIFITGDAGEETEVRGFREGASDHVRKPFVPEVLLQRTKRVIDLYHFQSGLKQEVGRQTARADRLSLEMMMALSKTVDAKDRYTNGHSGRVAEYSAEIARRMGKSEAEQEKIYEMGLMHDIGKIGVSEEIINKTSRLTDEEFAQIKKHTVIGCDILSTITEMPDLATGARSHHERYDGTGYPDGLKGEDIPEAARIICVADCYDAMTSTRTYSTPRSQAAVRAEIERCSGSQFDPVIAAVMLQMIDDDTGYKMNEQGGAHVWKNMDKLWNIQPDEPDEINKSLLPEFIYGIGEIDVPNGLLHCGTEQIYTDTLTAFAEAVGEQTDVIEQYWNARDIENLTIKVHAIKSTSRIIGAEDIGTLAERLEKAGHDNDITALENGMDELLTRCRSLGRQLKPLVKADDDSALPPISPEELSELYGIIREFYSVADYDSFTQMIENLGSYRIPDSEKERCRALREAADALDYDLIPEILDKE